MTITAKVLADSTHRGGKRLTTFELRYPRFIHSELMTHRVFSRNASSSRAIPFTKMIDEIKKDPAMPERWGYNGKGMQDHGEMTPEEAAECKKVWLEGLDYALKVVGKMGKLKAVPHKQIINRLLEPYAHIKVVVTATEWNNFYAQRRHEDADPTIQALANAMWEAKEASTPKRLYPGDWHLPYIEQYEWDKLRMMADDSDRYGIHLATLIKVSVARCARTSYRLHDGTVSSHADDLVLYDKLVGSMPMHASPAEHQASPDTFVVRHNPIMNRPEKFWDSPDLHGNLPTWIQYRQTLDGQYIA